MADNHDTTDAPLLQRLRRRLRKHGYQVNKHYRQERFLVYRVLNSHGIDWGSGGSNLTTSDLLRIADQIEGERGRL